MDAPAYAARCPGWARQQPSECLLNREFMRKECAASCAAIATGDSASAASSSLHFAAADVCEVAGAGTSGVNGFYYRTPGLSIALANIGGHAFGKHPYQLLFQPPDPGEGTGQSGQREWAGLLIAPELNVTDSRPFYFWWQRSGGARWDVAGSGAEPGARAACFARGREPAAALVPSVEQLVTKGRSDLGAERARQAAAFSGRSHLPDHFDEPTLARLEAPFRAALALNPTSELAIGEASRFWTWAAASGMKGRHLHGRVDLGALTHATRRLADAERLLPLDAAIATRQAEVRHWAWDLDGAAAARRRAVALAPREPEWRLELGRLLLTRRCRGRACGTTLTSDAQGAADAFSAALMLAPSRHDVYGYLGRALCEVARQRTDANADAAADACDTARFGSAAAAWAGFAEFAAVPAARARLQRRTRDAAAVGSCAAGDGGGEGGGGEGGEGDGGALACARDVACSAEERRRFVVASEVDDSDGEEVGDAGGTTEAASSSAVSDTGGGGGGGGACVVAWRTAGAGTLSHWGHTLIDGVWPFTVAFLRGELDCTEVWALDLGVFLGPLLASSFPSLEVNMFHDPAQLPPGARFVELQGHGMPKPFEPLVFRPRELRAARLYFWLNCHAQVEGLASAPTVLLLGRRAEGGGAAGAGGDAQGRPSAWQRKCQLDNSRHSRSLAAYHRTATNVGLAYDCGGSGPPGDGQQPAVTGAAKRQITNHGELEAALAAELGDAFAPLYPEDVTHCEQVARFAHARVVLAQHGAALANALYLPADALVLELEPMPTAVFSQLVEAAGGRHVALSVQEFPHLYQLADGAGLSHQLAVNVAPLVELVRSFVPA